MIETYIEEAYTKSISTGEFLFPFGLGEIKIYNYKPKVHNIEGKIKNYYMPDWAETLKFWEEDSEAFAQKKIIRKIVDRVYYHKYKRSTMLSKSLKIDFLLSRRAKRIYIDNIKNNIQNAFNTVYI